MTVLLQLPARRPVSPAPPRTAPSDAGQDPAAEVQATVRTTGLITWAALSLHSLLVEPGRDHLPLADVQWWGATNLVFLGALLLSVRVLTRLPRALALGLLLVQATLALVANAFLNGSSVQAGLLILVAAQVGLLLPFRQSVFWALAQSAALLFVLLSHWRNLDAWAFTTGYLCFQVLAVTTVRTAMREIRARQALAVVVDELQATRALLSEASRQAERLQISRELHDLLGHHLTALGMNLQVAGHLLPEGAARTHVLTAQEVARQLLGDVRTAVRGMRDTASCDFPQELRRIVQDTPLQVHLSLPDGLQLTCPITARVLLRSVQEILTNAARHARAQQVWLDIERDPQGLHLRAHDDGRGFQEPAGLRFGCGLKGMRERLESVGGRLEVQTRPGRGVELHALLPLRGLA